jgi:DNA-binding CsgD family transcriptional regulator
MDHVVSDDACVNERWQRIAAALRGGIVFVDHIGRVVGMDHTARQRLDGQVKQLELPLERAEAAGPDCFVSVETLSIGGDPTPVCIVQELAPDGREMMTAVESVLADTSSFARNIIERLKTLRVASSNVGSQDHLDTLTRREREILGLICEGKSDIEMSAVLDVSQNTVRNHIASLYRKIGVNRRSAAILWATERGITAESLRGRRTG